MCGSTAVDTRGDSCLLPQNGCQLQHDAVPDAVVEMAGAPHAAVESAKWKHSFCLASVKLEGHNLLFSCHVSSSMSGPCGSFAACSLDAQFLCALLACQ